MDYKYLIKFLSENEYKKYFVVTLSNGEKINVRLFVYQNTPCMCRKGKRCGDYIYSYDIKDWVDIRVKNEISKERKYKNFFKNCVKYLEQSGLWSEMLEDFKLILSNNELFNYILESESTENYSTFKNKLKEYGMNSTWVDCYITTIQKGIKHVRFNKYEREYIINNFNNEDKFSLRWKNGYDCTLSKQDGKAWYSEEFVGCLNGHYYLALDAKHAIFCEND